MLDILEASLNYTVLFGSDTNTLSGSKVPCSGNC